MPEVPEIDLSDVAVLRDPFTAYGRAREVSPVARLSTPGFGSMWAVTRHAQARELLADPRFRLNAKSYLRPDVPEHCLRYMRTMSEMDGPEHTRLRRLVSPAFTARRAQAFRPRITARVDALLDALPTGGDPVDLLPALARPLPMEVICDLVGVAEADRPAWHGYGVAIAAGHGAAFAEAVPAIMRDALAAVADRAGHPGEDLLSELLGIQAGDADRLSDDELVTLVWHLLLAGQTPTNLITNAVEALLAHPGQLAALRADETLMPAAVEELTRWAGPQLLSVPRYPVEDVEILGVRIPAGEPVTTALAAANRDPRAFTDPERLDILRPASRSAHLGYGHGPHFCLGAALARVQTEEALAGVLRRFPKLALAAGGAPRLPDPGTWRLGALVVTPE